MLPPLRLCGLGAILLLGSCGPRPGPQPSLGTLHQPLVHSFDLAQNMPPHLAIAFVMAWFGLPASEPTNPAPDPFWGNWSTTPPTLWDLRRWAYGDAN